MDFKGTKAMKLGIARRGTDVVEREGCQGLRKDLVWVDLVHRGDGDARVKTEP